MRGRVGSRTRSSGDRGSRWWVGLMLLLGSSWVHVSGARPASANPGSANARSSSSRGIVDRAVVRFSAPEAGGVSHPHFIFERELAFEARLVALADPAHRAEGAPYRRHHLQAALERHIAETLLASLSMTPEPTSDEMLAQQNAARARALSQIGGEAPLLEAARAEGLGSLELRSFFRRRARASFYLDRMVVPMLEPSLIELRRVHAEGKTPFSDRSFAEIEEPLRRWYIAQNLSSAVTRYFQNARARLRIEYLPRPQPPQASPVTSAR